jgi:chromosome segregation protein
MKLKRLEIYGFKSFAQRTEFVFDQGITGIVGPNGSGKSNIGDAVRWVLGEQSPRVLRGSKMEDVIFNGTEKRKPIAFCEVSIVFDNENHALNVQFAEVSVTRRAYRNGESEYFLNKAACRLRDILELFRDTGIGREGYSLIGQGRIDEILSVRSEDRREAFEEAAGIVTFRVRKEEAERKLARTRENLVRVSDILDDLAGRLGPLAEQAKAAQEYLTLAEKLRGLDMNIFLSRYDKARERTASLSALTEGLSGVLAEHDARLRDNTLERGRLDSAASALDDELAGLQQARLLSRDTLHEALAALDGTKQLIKNAESTLVQLNESALEIAGNQRDLDELFSRGEGEAEYGREGLRKAQADLDAAQELLTLALNTETLCENELDVHKTDILNAVNRLSDARNMQARSQTMCEQMENRLTEILASRDELVAQQSGLAAALQYAEARHIEVSRGLEALTADSAGIDTRLAGLTREFAAKSEQTQQQALSVQSDQSRLRLLEEMARDLEGYAHPVRSALAFASDDKAVHGVVAQLIQVSAQLETAIDMALGGALQDIVTDNDETAKRIIDHLRQNKLGRATFLPISAMRPRTLSAQEHKLLAMPGCLGVACELITYDPAYRGIMENLLGRTVIARDLASGIPIMRAGQHAFRLVTLAGDVMHSGGSMTGGTTQGKVSSLLGRERETKELRLSLEEHTGMLRASRQTLTDLENRRGELRRMRDEAVTRVHQEEIAVAREQEHVRGARLELEAHAARLEKTRDAAAQLTQSIAEIREDLARASVNTDSVAFDRDAMDMKTSLLQQALADARIKTESLRERVAGERLAFAELSHAAETLRRDKSRWDAERRELEESLARIQDRRAEYNARIVSAREQLALLTNKEADCVAGEARITLMLSQAEARRQELIARQRAVAQETEDTHARRAEDSQKLHRAELALAGIENDLKTLTAYIWNTYELTYAGAEQYRCEGRFDLSGSERAAADLKKSIRELGTVNVRAVEEYAEARQRHDSLMSQRDDAVRAEKDLQALITRLLSQMERQFEAEFKKLDAFFRQTFARLFGGGHAELKLSDPNDPLGCEIDIVAQPPGKKAQLLSLLSGGERALTAIAILFAMLKLKPTPFCVLDEIEAALDEANIGYFADYLAEYKLTTQFVVITHRKGTMERCDALYGVAMEERGISSMVSVNLAEYE